MYYCASTAPRGDTDTIEAKWRIVVLHVQNIHGQCTHEPMAGEVQHRLWIS